MNIVTYKKNDLIPYRVKEKVIVTDLNQNVHKQCDKWLFFTKTYTLNYTQEI